MVKPGYLEGNLCGNQQPYVPFIPAVCTECDSQWLEARYDYDTFKREILRGLPHRPSNMWRYQDVLPLSDPASLDLYPAGGTPLWFSQRFAPDLGHGSVFIKDACPRTKEIPVVVVNAKDITDEERRRLNGHIEAVYQKGSLTTRKFVDQLIHVIEEANEGQEHEDKK